jgi:hypothetical protein
MWEHALYVCLLSRLGLGEGRGSRVDSSLSLAMHRGGMLCMVEVVEGVGHVQEVVEDLRRMVEMVDAT